MYFPSDVAEPSPMIRLERLRARCRAEHLAELDATPGSTPQGCGRRDLVAEAFAAIDAAIHEDLGSHPDAELDARMVAVTALADRAGVLRAVTAGAWAPRATWSGRGPWSSAAGWLDRETGMARSEAHRVIKTGAVIA